MNRRLTSAAIGSALAAALTFGATADAFAAQALDVDNVFEIEVEKNGKKAVVNAVDDALNDLDLELLDGDLDVAVVEIEDSLNNLQALNNVLNNNDIDVDIQDIDVLNDFEVEILEDILNDLELELDDVIGVDILDGGDFLVIVD